MLTNPSDKYLSLWVYHRHCSCPSISFSSFRPLLLTGKWRGRVKWVRVSLPLSRLTCSLKWNLHSNCRSSHFLALLPSPSLLFVVCVCRCGVYAPSASLRRRLERKLSLALCHEAIWTKCSFFQYIYSLFVCVCVLMCRLPPWSLLSHLQCTFYRAAKGGEKEKRERGKSKWVAVAQKSISTLAQSIPHARWGQFPISCASFSIRLKIRQTLMPLGHFYLFYVCLRLPP